MKASNGRDWSDKISDLDGYFDVVVRPMLQQGHEGELCGWLKEMSLIKTSCVCTSEQCEGRNLVWSPARVVDKYNWACLHCSKKQTIRDNSFFLSIKCEFKTCLQIILAWCKMFPSDIAASCLDVKEHVVKKVYERCAKIADDYVNSHLEEFKLGGPDSVLIVDEYPGGYMTENVPEISVSRKRNNNSHTILCIAEANALPPRMWLHMIRAVPATANKTQGNIIRCGMVEEALKEIVRHVLPGSVLVANHRSRCCSYESIKELKQFAVISVEYLKNFDVPGKNKLVNNLETIWQTAVDVCEEVQESTNSLGRQIISTHLWRQRFNTLAPNAFECMLNQIAEAYKFT
ncbi:uncharacterized protein [Venturia canescens]|uniref:uncharacterized protein n=1 Tax=Venturia canescens TaxID=32260 RepID=UPI001C9C3011|nr:uncharacterized protein LOC122409633 [Venturia canescens]